MGVVSGAISIKDNATATLQSIRKEHSAFRQDVAKTRQELIRTWDKKYQAKIEATAATKKISELRQKMEPLRKKIVTAVAIKDMATAKVREVTNKVKAVGKMAAKPIVAIKDATAAGLSKIKSSLKSIAIGVVIPATIAATALAGASIGQGAKLEQSMGGVETLFKESSSVVKANADMAFKTAGLSANDYMETVTSFSASLLNSLGGDTAKSAQVADMAITDMADNANKFGTDMESIQNAYQGFTKQNYTMLDNLKLGYGGTKEEMSRLLNDATKLTGVKYDMDNLSDVYNAIHSIQKNLGVTGTTAKEASATFSGSFAAMKASAANLLGNLATGGDVTGSMEQLVGSASTFLFNNALPMIGRIFTALPGAIKTGIDKSAPLIKAAGGTIVKSLKDGMVSILPSSMGGVVDSLFSSIGNFGNKFAEITPHLTAFGGTVMSSVAVMAASVMPAIGSIIGTVTDVIPSVMPILSTTVGYITTLVSGAAPIISGLIEGVGIAVTTLAPIFNTIFSGISEKVGTVLSFVGERMGFIQQIISTVAPLIGDILSTAWSVISPIMDLAISVFKIVFSVVQRVFPGIQKILQGVWTVIKPIVEGFGGAIKTISAGASWVADKLSGGGGSGGSPAPVGNNASGTNSWRGGVTWVGERGPELLEVPKGARILPNKESVRFASGNSGSVASGGVIRSVMISIAKLADQIIVREDADIDKIGTVLAKKVVDAVTNMVPQPT